MTALTCRSCGAQNSPGVAACASCGAALGEHVMPSAPAAPPVGMYQQRPVPATAGSTGLATASLVLGIIGLIVWLLPLLGFPVNILGVIFGVLGRRSVKNGTATAGLVCSIIGLFATLINAIAGALMMIAAFGDL